MRSETRGGFQLPTDMKQSGGQQWAKLWGHWHSNPWWDPRSEVRIVLSLYLEGVLPVREGRVALWSRLGGLSSPTAPEPPSWSSATVLPEWRW